MSAFEACDPAIDPDEWTPVEASGARDAVRRFLSLKGYDERDFDPARPFTILVRPAGDGHSSGITVRVVPAHFEVA